MQLGESHPDKFKHSSLDLLCCSFAKQMLQIADIDTGDDAEALCGALSSIAARTAAILNAQTKYAEALREIEEALTRIRALSDSNRCASNCCSLLKLRVFAALGCAAMDDEQRSKTVFAALGCADTSERDGLAIIDFMSASARVPLELVVEALNKLFCRFPRSALLSARRLQLELGRGVEHQVAAIQCVLGDGEQSASKWSEREKQALAKRLWNLGAAHHRRRDFASSDEIWSHSLPLFLSLRGKRATKCNVLRARCIANLECARYTDALRMLRRAEELQHNIKNVVLELRIQLKLGDARAAQRSLDRLEADAAFSPNLYALLQRDVCAADAAELAPIRARVLEAAFAHRHSIEQGLRNDALSLKCLLHFADTSADKTKHYLAQCASLSLARDEDVSWFAVRCWDFALRDGSPDLFEAASSLLDRLDGDGDSSELCSAKAVCRVFGAVAAMQSVWGHAEQHQRSAKRALLALDGVQLPLAATDSMTDGLEAVVLLVRFKCFLVLSDAQRTRASMASLLRTSAANIVHLEAMLHCLRRLGLDGLGGKRAKRQSIAALCQHIVAHIDIEQKRRDGNVTLDVLADHLRYLRMLIAVQAKLKTQSCFRAHFESVARLVSDQFDGDEHGRASQQMLLDDELKWFVAKSWNLGVSVCSKSVSVGGEAYAASLASAKAWFEISIKLSRHTQSDETVEAMRENMQSALRALQLLIDSQ